MHDSSGICDTAYKTAVLALKVCDWSLVSTATPTYLGLQKLLHSQPPARSLQFSAASCTFCKNRTCLTHHRSGGLYWCRATSDNVKLYTYLQAWYQSVPLVHSAKAIGRNEIPLAGTVTLVQSQMKFYLTGTPVPRGNGTFGGRNPISQRCRLSQIMLALVVIVTLQWNS